MSTNIPAPHRPKRKQEPRPTPTEEQAIALLRAALRKCSQHAGPIRLARLIGIAFEREFPARSSDQILANALVRGIAAWRLLTEAEGGSMAAKEAARLLNIPVAEITRRYRAGTVIGWRDDAGAIRFPIWQFQEDGLLPGMAVVLRALRPRMKGDDAGVMLFFLQQRDVFNGKRALDHLRSGAKAKVAAVARGDER